MAALPPAGWYPEPSSPTGQRYWDGSQWTQQVNPPQVGGAPTTTPWQAAVMAESTTGLLVASQNTLGKAPVSLNLQLTLAQIVCSHIDIIEAPVDQYLSVNSRFMRDTLSFRFKIDLKGKQHDKSTASQARRLAPQNPQLGPR